MLELSRDLSCIPYVEERVVELSSPGVGARGC